MSSASAVNQGEQPGSRSLQAAQSKLPYLAVVLLGAALGLSEAIHGAYDEATWSPIALAILALLLAFALGAPRRPPLAAALPLLGLALWSLISSGWGDSTDSAWIAADRWLLYAAALVLLARLVAGDRRRAELLIAGAAIGVGAVTVWMLLQMLRNHGASLFLGSRLNDPLGYVNAQAGYLLAGAWPCCALAERRDRAPLAGLGMAGLVALVGVGALASSRSSELALVVSALLVVVAMPGRRRRIAILLIAAAAIYAIYSSLSRVSQVPVATNAAVHHAAVAIVLAAVIAGLVWGVAVGVLQRWAPADVPRGARVGQIATVALVVLAVAAAIGLALNAGRISHTVRNQYRAFTHLSTSPSSSRFLSGAGNRYDYWRVAWLEFRSQPLRGVGAGNFQPGYYLHRRTTEAIQQPHSIELQTLAELGLVGAALLSGFLAVVVIAVVRAARQARGERATRFLAVAATGLFAGWLVQTSVDWEHLVPGLTFMALAAVAALLSLGEQPAAPVQRRTHAYLIGAFAVLACAGSLLIAPRVASLRAQTSAQRALQHHDPRRAIIDATRALDYDASSVPALVLRAAGFARFDAFALARADLERALRIEPHNWVTFALIGDLLTRHGNRAAARSFYRRALALNPLDSSLQGALALLRAGDGRSARP